MQVLAKKLIPGKTQLLSKRPEMFAPGVWPGYYSKAKGAHIWDLDGNMYLDFSIGGIGANILGYADDYVDSSVINAINSGSSSSLNCFEEIDLAELMMSIHPWAEMFRYTRSGGEAMALSVRIARAHTNKELILFCGYHGWHDWYLSANIADGDNLSEHLLHGLSPRGVPPSLEGSAIPFKYNDLDSLIGLVEKNKGKIAAIVMEPIHNIQPDSGYLEAIRQLASDNSIVLIFDEITSGFRVAPSGIHLVLGVTPDIAVFSKAVSNGYPMSIVMGGSEVMQSAQETFISSTSWTERIGPTAAIATINRYIKLEAHSHLELIGKSVQGALKRASTASQLEIQIEGFSTLFNFKFKHKDDLAMRTYFTQEMLQVGFLAAGRFYAMYAHKKEHVNAYEIEATRIFCEIAELLQQGNLFSHLIGDVAHNGFRRLN
ncbi:MAG: aminotransferase class III-fold pyridoxal phosphate-dependent enzyme [Actinomycetales bacterium]|nr:MAG: aminotransferase class III-fold pyridoxal phosphate-dependent enzyme [Actinomycetales bacterium]